MTPITRKDASAAGLRHFYTGKPCKRGHMRERAVATGSCLGCLAVYAKEYAAKFSPPKRSQLMGAVPMTVNVRPEHAAAITAFAALFEHSVITGTPAPRVPHQDDVGTINTMIDMLGAERGTAPPPAPPAFDPYPMWVKIHGQEVADQMRDGGA